MRAVQIRGTAKKIQQLVQLGKQALRDGAYRVANRLHAVALNMEGRTAPEIADVLKVHRSNVCLWLERWQVDGMEGILEGHRAGRPPAISERQRQQLADILESGRHLLSLINDILDLSKIEAGRMELDVTHFDLNAAIENTLILVRERAQRHAIALRHDLDERLGMIHADERKLKQVLLNLLSNALKFTPDGGHIDVRARRHDAVVEIGVSDTGVGIAPEDQATVFEEFRQVGAAAKKVEGTGLGLAISRKIIELHGGTIRVDSRLGSGSTFTITLPLARTGA